MTSASAIDVLIGINPQWGFTTEGFITLAGTGAQQYTVSPTLGGVPITHVFWVAINGAVITRTSTHYISQIQLNNDGSITILFSNAIVLGAQIKIAVGLYNNAVAIQEKTKSITEMSTVEIITQTIPAGPNATQLVFSTSGIIFSAQSELSGLNTYQSIIYINGTATPVTTSLQGSFAVVSLGTAIVPGTIVSIVVNRALSLVSNQRLQIYYQYVPYQGVTGRLSFGNGGNAQVQTRVIAKSKGLLVHTSVQNGLSRTVPDQYSPISTKLPLPFAAHDADLNSDPLGAFIYPSYKGLGLSSDFTIAQVFAPNAFEALHGWTPDGADTTGITSDSTRPMFGMNTVRFNKSGTSTTLSEIQRTPFSTDWSTVIDNSGNVLNGDELAVWFYLPDSDVVTGCALILATSGGNHVYQISELVTGWNKATFTSRTTGTATTNTIINVMLQVDVTATSVTQYGFSVVPPYIEQAGSALTLNDGDVFFAQSKNAVYQFLLLEGMSEYMSDGFLTYKDREYSFDSAIVAGTENSTSTKITPPAPLGANFVSKVGVNNVRGTPNGSLYYSTAADTLASINKQAVMYTLEQVVDDQTGNFALGEFLLRVETKMSTGTTVEVSNNDFTSQNSIDVFRLPLRWMGKPLI